MHSKKIHLQNKIELFFSYLIKYRHFVLRFFDIHCFERIDRSVHRKLVIDVVIREMIDLERDLSLVDRLDCFIYWEIVVFEEDQQNESTFDVLLSINVRTDVWFLGKATGYSEKIEIIYDGTNFDILFKFEILCFNTLSNSFLKYLPSKSKCSRTPLT